MIFHQDRQGKCNASNAMLDLHAADFISLCQGFIILVSSGERSGKKKFDHKTHMGKYDVPSTKRLSTITSAVVS